MTMTTLSLEPLRAALTDVDEKGEAVLDVAPDIAATATLAARLQRLWLERGDFGKISTSSLQQEAGDDQKKSAETSLLVGTEESLVETAAASSGDDDEVNSQLTPEQLWNVKSEILQGLNLARIDITSALDLLQLLLNPLGALNPVVPEDALALPSGSLSASLLHVPLPPPSEQVLLNNMALSFATKVKSVGAASSVLRKASQRLGRTTNTTQNEWTELLRLKRAGEWRLEAHGSRVPASSLDVGAPVNIDKLAKDVFVFCGIEEAQLQWRQAGIARLKDSTTPTSGTDEKGSFRFAERVEGRRRLAVKISLSRAIASTMDDVKPDDREDYEYTPLSLTKDDEESTAGVTSSLSRAQRELFEEELFAQIVHEARESSHKVNATRESITLTFQADQGKPIAITFTMVPSDTTPRDASSTTRESARNVPLARIAHAVVRLALVEIYRSRRRNLQITSAQTAIAMPADPPRLLPLLVELLTYYAYVTNFRNHLLAIRNTVAGLCIFDAQRPLLVDFVGLLDEPNDVWTGLQNGATSEGGQAVRLGSSIILQLGDHSLHFTLSSSKYTTILHLPERDVTLPSRSEVDTVLQQGVRAAVLGQLEHVLNNATNGKQGWEVLPTPPNIGKNARALARRSVPGVTAHIAEFIAVTPVVSISNGTSKISLEAIFSIRSEDRTVRSTFISTPDATDHSGQPNLPVWLAEQLSG